MNKSFDISSSSLHIIAMILMLCDHICMTLLNNKVWLHLIGRASFPIFAFMAVEGYYHTKDLKKYLLRLFVFALIAEVPFDLMCAGIFVYPFQQNALFTYILGILGILVIDQTKKIKSPFVKYPVFAVTALLMWIVLFVLGQITMVDYFGGGIVMILSFYLFREDRLFSFKIEYKEKWMSVCMRIINMIMQFALVYYIAAEMISGLCYNVVIFGRTYELVAESFGVFALIPIWLYRGRKGIDSKAFKYFCYAFYPLHIALLVLIHHIIY